MSKFKKIPPCVILSSCGSSVGVGVSVLEDVDGRQVFVSKSSKDAFPEIPKSDAFSLENQLKSGAQLKEVSIEKVVNDVDRLDNQFADLSSRTAELESMLTQSEVTNSENVE